MAGIDIPVSLSDGLSSPFDDITNSVTQAFNELEKLKKLMESDFSNGFDGIGNQTQRNTKYQHDHNNAIREGTTAADGLLGKVKSIAGTYLTLMGLKKTISLGDTMQTNATRVDMINDGLQTNLQLNQQIFDVAQRTRSSYIDTINTVTKLGILARDAFSSNKELLAFTETMNKAFKVSGASMQEQKAAMYQLTQAMASGRLQGDEFRSIRENAPLLAQAIQKELDGIGIDSKKASSEGMITNDIIKRAVFNMADEIDAKFNEFPEKFSELARRMVDNFILGMSPLWGAFSRLWNNKYVTSFVDNSIVAFHILGQVAGAVIDSINSGITFIGDNWSWLSPIIYGVVGAFLIYKGVLAGIAIWHGIVAGVQTVASFVMEFYAVSTGHATVAQHGLNAALMANPWMLVILAVIAVIAIYFVVIAVINKVTGSHISAVGVIVGALFALWTFTINTLKSIINFTMLIVEGAVNLFQLGVSAIINQFLKLLKNVLSIARGITSCFDSVATNIANAMVDGINVAIRAVNKLISALNKIPGIDIGKIGEMSHTASITHTIDTRIAKIDGLMASNKANAGRWKAPQLEYGSVLDSYRKGYKIGQGIGDKVKGFFDFNKGKKKEEKYDPSQFLGQGSPAGNSKALKDTAGNTKKIAENTDNSKLDVRYLREMAERQAINRFTTAEIKIQNNISQIKTEDLDGFVDHLNTELQERLENQVEGYYTA